MGASPKLKTSGKGTSPKNFGKWHAGAHAKERKKHRIRQKVGSGSCMLGS